VDEGSFGWTKAPSGPTRQALRLSSLVGRWFGPAERDPKERVAPEVGRPPEVGSTSHVFPPLAIAIAKLLNSDLEEKIMKLT